MKSSKKIISLVLALFLALGLGLSPVAKIQAEELVTNQKGIFEQLFSSEWMARYQEALQEPGGFENTVEFTLGDGLLMGATERQMLESLQYRFKYLQIPNEDPLNTQTQLEIAMMNRLEPEKELAMTLYNVGQQAVVEIPRILDKPILLNEEVYTDLSGSFTGTDITAALPTTLDYTQLPLAMQSVVEEFASNFEEQDNQPITLNIDQITENLTASVKFLPADQLYPAVKTLLERVRDNEEFAPLLDAIQQHSDAEALQNPNLEAGNVRAELEQAIQNLQNEATLNNISVTLVELFDEQGNSRGYRVSFDKEQIGESVLFEAFRLEEPASMTSAFTIKLSMIQGGYAQEVMGLTGNAAPNAEGLYTINFLLSVFNEETLETENLMDGVISNLVIIDSEVPEEAILEADVDLNIYTYELQQIVTEYDIVPTETELETTEEAPAEDTEVPAEDTEAPAEDAETPDEDAETPNIDENATETIDLDAYSFDYEMVSMVVNLKGRIEAHGKTALVDLTIVPDNNLENQFINLKVKTNILEADEIVVPTELPQEFYDLEKEEDMQTLQTDEMIQQNLMLVLQDLGLLPASAPQQP